MHMTKNQNEAHNQYSFWSACVMLVTAFAIADALTGGLIREKFTLEAVELVGACAFVIATIGVFLQDAPPGLRFIRACSRHKL